LYKSLKSKKKDVKKRVPISKNEKESKVNNLSKTNTKPQTPKGGGRRQPGGQFLQRINQQLPGDASNEGKKKGPRGKKQTGLTVGSISGGAGGSKEGRGREKGYNR